MAVKLGHTNFQFGKGFARYSFIMVHQQIDINHPKLLVRQLKLDFFYIANFTILHIKKSV